MARCSVCRSLCAFVLALSIASCKHGAHEPPGNDRVRAIAIDPTRMARVGQVDERYQSYNVEMLEVTGGKFWRPYGPELEAALRAPAQAAPAGGGDTPAGMNPGVYRYRPPIDLANPTLRRLAAALGPAYVRVSGTWANTTFFPESDAAPAQPPPGFMGVLTRGQWKGVVEFAKAADAEIVTSFSTGEGTRDASGVWTPEQARRLAEYTRAIGGRIAAAEFMNEPNLAAMGGAPPGYDAAAYGRDVQVFRAFARATLPDMTILGPGSVGETVGEHAIAYSAAGTLATRDLLAGSGPGVDAFSYHHYGAVSRRCAAMDNQTTPDAALSEDWLRRTDETLSFYRKLRDAFEPGKPFWLTETADAACGGNPWAATFLDTFRYLDQLGRLAKQNVRVVMHNTLVASDYGLLDDDTFAPKAMYWGALLWRKLMGTTVLESGVPVEPGLHVYAHCLRDVNGGVALLALNTDRAATRTLAMPAASERFALTAHDLDSRTVELNGRELKLGEGAALPEFRGAPTAAGEVVLAPASITFLAVPGVGNGACARAP
jgi:glycosyl hydrolase family 79